MEENEMLRSFDGGQFKFSSNVKHYVRFTFGYYVDLSRPNHAVVEVEPLT